MDKRNLKKRVCVLCSCGPRQSTPRSSQLGVWCLGARAWVSTFDLHLEEWVWSHSKSFSLRNTTHPSKEIYQCQTWGVPEMLWMLDVSSHCVLKTGSLLSL